MQARRWVSLSILLVGCANDDALRVEPLPPKDGVVGISVTPVSATIAVGAQITLIAVVAGGFCPPTCTVTWASSDTMVASVVADSGVVAARSSGLATVTATARGDTNFRASVQITVTP